MTVARDAKGAELVDGGRHGEGITVDPQHADALEVAEQGSGVTAPAHGGVDKQARRHRAEQLDDLVGHHRLVGKGLAHPQSPDRHKACGWSAATFALEVGGGGIFQGCGRGTAHGPDALDVYVVAGHGGQAGFIG